MPIDFKALMNVSPEERAANAERSRLEFEAQMKARISKRQAELEHIARAMDDRPGAFARWDHDFISDLKRKAQQTDLSGYEGGYLMDLSGPQSSQIERLTKMANDLIGPADGLKEDSQTTNDRPAAPEKRKGFRPR